MTRDKIISIKCSEKEAEQIQQAAARSGMPVSSYLREIGTEGRYARRSKDKALIAEIVHITQLSNENRGYSEVQEELKREVAKLWQIL
jgi:hypothetical protein